MRKTKIICSLGPASWTNQGINSLRKAGMNVARFNFSHGSHKQHLQTIQRVRAIDSTIAIMLDTKGPEVRTGKVKDDEILLKTGKSIIVTTNNIIGNEKKLYINYTKLPETLSKGDSILIEDGLIELQVQKIKNREIHCKIAVGGILGNTKNVNIPNRIIDLPALSKKDIEDINFGIEHKVDFIVASFIRSKKDLLQIKRLLHKHNSPIKIIAKIEHQEAVDKIDEIIEHADGIMVARGDLGVQVPQQEIPIIQKRILRKCRETATPCIVATQMLDSMIRNPRPTRAEVTDVANAILDGADAVMLSGETAKGQFPTKSVETMVSIATSAEKILEEEYHMHHKPVNEIHAISKLAVIAGQDIGAKAIIVPTRDGFTARKISTLRPTIPIVALTPSAVVQRQLALHFAVFPLIMKHPRSTDSLIQESAKRVYKERFVTKKDVVIVTASTDHSLSSTNLLEIRLIGDILHKTKKPAKLIVRRR